MATFLQLQNRVYYVLRDNPQAYVTLASVKDWINEAYLDIVARLRNNKQAVADTFSATGTDTLPADFIEAISLRVATDDASVFDEPEWTSDSVFLSYRNADTTPGHTLARIFDGSIETWPEAQSRAYTLEYVQKPVALSMDADVPAIPEELHVRLVNYARAHAKWQEGEPDEGDRYMALYAEGLPSAPTGGYRERPGPRGWSLAPETIPGVFD